MGLFDFLKRSKGRDIDFSLPDLPHNLDSPKEILEKAKDLAETNKEMVQEVTEQIKDAIPGNADNTVIDKVTDKINSK
ncbi:MAG: hypothetical protein M3Q79_01165 [bacterium]|nr:hypothetical protein [bacterium]